MSKLPLFVGLDYHKESIQVCVMDGTGEVLTNSGRENNWEAVAKMVPDGYVAHAAIEACNGASDLADELVHKAGWSVSLAHPGYVARIKQSPDKTDFGDARLLADLQRVGYLPKVWHAPTWIRELRRVVRYRQSLVANRKNVKLRIRALLRDHRVTGERHNPWTKKWLTWLRETDALSGCSRWIMDQYLIELESLIARIEAVEDRLSQETKEDRLVQHLLGLSGVGPITAVTLRAEIGRFDRFRSGKQLSRFCGVTPRNASSGQKESTSGLIKAGNPELRRVLVQLAHRLIRHDAHWRQMACRLEGKGKPKCVVIAAVANRWLRRQYHELKTFGLSS
jgi:transposase